MGKIRMAMVDVSSNKIYRFHNDRMGTPQLMTDETGVVVWEAIYKPFGEAQIHPQSIVVNNFRSPGQYYDQETGLHFNYHRYYDPNTGKYITPDLLSFSQIQIIKRSSLNRLLQLPTDPSNIDEIQLFFTTSLVYHNNLNNPQALNIYSYSLGNPVNFFDPTGEGVIDLLKCGYYTVKVHKYQEACKKEIGTSFEEECDFYRKYGGGSPSDAVMNCVRNKVPDLYYKWIKSCFKGGFGPGSTVKPKPMPRY